VAVPVNLIAPGFGPLFFPSIAHKQTAQNVVLSIRFPLVAHFIILILSSGNQGLLKSDEQVNDLKEPCAHLWNIL
jgi:hypothetical protein